MMQRVKRVLFLMNQTIQGLTELLLKIIKQLCLMRQERGTSSERSLKGSEALSGFVKSHG